MTNFEYYSDNSRIFAENRDMCRNMFLKESKLEFIKHEEMDYIQHVMFESWLFQEHKPLIYKTRKEFTPNNHNFFFKISGYRNENLETMTVGDFIMIFYAVKMKRPNPDSDNTFMFDSAENVIGFIRNVQNYEDVIYVEVPFPDNEIFKYRMDALRKIDGKVKFYTESKNCDGYYILGE